MLLLPFDRIAMRPPVVRSRQRRAGMGRERPRRLLYVWAGRREQIPQQT